MSWLLFLWFYGSLVITPLALYWRPGARERAGVRMCSLVLALGAGALAATIYLSLGGII